MNMDSTEPPAEGMTRRRQARIGGVAALALVATLLLALSSCSPTDTHGSSLASGSPTAGDRQTPNTPDDPKDATPTTTRSNTPTATRTFTPTATKTPTKTATPLPQTPSTHEVARTTTFYGGSVIPATATCPQGELELGGGWSVPPQGARVFAAMISDGAWSVSAFPVGHTASTTLTAYGECLRGAAGAVVTPYSTPFSVPATSFNGGTVACTGSEQLVGWGFSFGASSSVELTATHPEINGWTLEFVNHSGVDQTGSLVAECLSNVNVGANRINSSGVNVPMGATGTNQVSCPLGTAAVGGYQYSSAGGGNLYLLHATSTGWQASAYAATTSIYFNVWAMCLYFQ